jgi:DNA-binding IclR family transcriptional regulator
MSQTVLRATKILELIAERPRKLSELAAEFGLHRSTTFRELQSLQSAGFVVLRSDKTYDVGANLIAIAQRSLDNLEVRRVAQDRLHQLHSRVGNTIHLAQLIEQQVVYVDKIDSRDGVRLYSHIGGSVQPQCSGVGKAILAQLSPARRDVVLQDVEWTAHTPTTLTTRTGLDAELATIKQQGWAIDNGEFEEFVNCIAAPIVNSSRTIIGAVSITSLKMINDLDQLGTHLDDLLETAQGISRDLG